MNSGVPFMELYRPKKFEEIVLDPLNREILKNIIETSYFPNLLFYGPPGTGKTTTIINLINAYQEKLNIKNKDLVIHLNASDERGIDIIRNNINFFVNSKPLFHTGMKFVILDEVDYMTKNAQQALRYLLQNYSSNVRFCLICNYISKIDEGLQNEFIRLRFNQLPREEIIQFLSKISQSEKLQLDKDSLSSIQKLYKSDLRSMINFLQSNQDIVKYQNKEKKHKKNEKHEKHEKLITINIIDDDTWENLIKKIKNREKIETINNNINEISILYNIDKKNLVKDFLNFIIRNHTEYVNCDFLHFVENLLHSQNQNNHIYIHYSISQLYLFLSKSKSE